MSAPLSRYRNGKDPVLKLRCPGCHRLKPFARLGGPQKEMHPKRAASQTGRGCRYVVRVDPFGSEHEWIEVDDNETVEDVWRRERVEWDERHSLLLLEAMR